MPTAASERHTLYHAVHWELDAGQNHHGDSLANWELDGWAGGDANKLAVKTEAEYEDDATTQAELWLMYSRNVATFWDAQIGMRQDAQPVSLTYLVLGIEGLARYFFETEAHLFVSDEGDLSARIRQENDILFTQRLIAQPYLEAEFHAQDISSLEVGAGLAEAEFGLQTRYEFTRDFAVYLDISYARKFGETSAIAKRNGEDNDAVIGTFGVKLLF